MPGDSGCNRGDYARVLYFIFAREAAGAAGTRHSPRPLRRRMHAQLGRIASRGCRLASGLLSCLKLNRSLRDGAPAPDPESRDSGFDALHRPGMTTSGLLRRCAHTCACSFRKPYSRRRSQSSRRCDRTTRCSSDKRRCRRNPRVRRTAALEFAASHWPRISRWP